ncbi:MAG: hypothetical protein LAT55_06760, partial [Opitutales bacterium]|nr:hypothetical protein [Opitutales bacterium]
GLSSTPTLGRSLRDLACGSLRDLLCLSPAGRSHGPCGILFLSLSGRIEGSRGGNSTDVGRGD